MPLALLLASAAATAVGAASLHAVHGLRRQITALRADLAADRRTRATVPAARTSTAPASSELPLDDIRAAVSDALAEERERELAEARAFWAAQEARDAPSPLAGLSGLGEDAVFFLPRQSDLAGLEADLADLGPITEPGPLDRPVRDLSAMDLGAADPGPADLSALNLDATALDTTAPDAAHLDALRLDPDELEEPEGRYGPAGFPEDSPELAAARRRHPSHPDFVPVQMPRGGAVSDHERTVTRLEELAEARTVLADVRPGPLGTLDVYVFADGTTLCMSPGHHETAQRLAAAVLAGEAPVLLGGSGVSGAYALTFACGDESVYVLADRVIASY